MAKYEMDQPPKGSHSSEFARCEQGRQIIGVPEDSRGLMVRRNKILADCSERTLSLCLWMRIYWLKRKIQNMAFGNPFRDSAGARTPGLVAEAPKTGSHQWRFASVKCSSSVTRGNQDCTEIRGGGRGRKAWMFHITHYLFLLQK